MTTLYVINLLPNAKGLNIVHRYGCTEFPDNFYEIGLYSTCKKAVHSARQLLPNATCCPTCITGCSDPHHLEENEIHKQKILNLDTK